MLTDTAIRKAKPADKPLRLFDGSGLYLEVSPAGGKLWRLKYRFGGKEKRLALGAHPDISLADARDRRDDARKLLANGADPGEVKKAAKAETAKAAIIAADTFEAVALAWLARQGGAEVTLRKSRWILETFLFPEIGSTPLPWSHRARCWKPCAKWRPPASWKPPSVPGSRPGRCSAGRSWKGRSRPTPTASLRGALKAPKNKHHAAITDPARIGELLRAIDGFTGQPVTLAALKLAPLVFVRPGFPVNAMVNKDLVLRP